MSKIIPRSRTSNNYVTCQGIFMDSRLSTTINRYMEVFISFQGHRVFLTPPINSGNVMLKMTPSIGRDDADAEIVEAAEAATVQSAADVSVTELKFLLKELGGSPLNLTTHPTSHEESISTQYWRISIIPHL
ncbi:hypothetical protein J6590_000685 [Homalodisca vitripennis]|nr:hypothetical protein J6590_000685 [Homalodisca vitripennis]